MRARPEAGNGWASGATGSPWARVPLPCQKPRGETAMSTITQAYVRRATHQGVLVLTVLAPQLHGDRLVSAVGHELEEAAGPDGAAGAVLDLGQVRSLSSAAFRPLLSLRRALQARGARLV